MKKYLLLLLLLLIILLLPVTAKADRALDYGTFTLYSDKEQPTKESNIFFKTEELCDDFSCDGMLIYNADELQFNSVTYEIPNIENKDKLETAIKVLEDKPGSIKYDFQLKNLESINKNEENNYVTINIIAKFTLKSAPTGIIEVTHTYLDRDFKEIESLKIKKELEVPKIENNIEKDTNTSTEKEDNIILIIWIIIVIILFTLIILIKKKKNNKSD